MLNFVLMRIAFCRGVVSQCFKKILSVHLGQCLGKCLHLLLCKLVSLCVETDLSLYLGRV